MTIAGKIRRIRSANSGYFSVYSVSPGRSPRRYRAANSSARGNRGSASESDWLMVFARRRGGWWESHSELEAPRRVRQDVPEPIQGAEIALAGRRLLDAQHLG